MKMTFPLEVASIKGEKMDGRHYVQYLLLNNKQQQQLILFFKKKLMNQFKICSGEK